jgi:hypothetical protein
MGSRGWLAKLICFGHAGQTQQKHTKTQNACDMAVLRVRIGSQLALSVSNLKVQMQGTLAYEYTLGYGTVVYLTIQGRLDT